MFTVETIRVPAFLLSVRDLPMEYRKDQHRYFSVFAMSEVFGAAIHNDLFSMLAISVLLDDVTTASMTWFLKDIKYATMFGKDVSQRSQLSGNSISASR